MGIFSEIARENVVSTLAGKIKKKIEEHKRSPKVVKILKEVGRDVLEELESSSEQFKPYEELFREDQPKRRRQ